ncbi:MAG: S8 family serine peptidase, partial [Candidatus Eiseniibacteriota bacterium]
MSRTHILLAAMLACGILSGPAAASPQPVITPAATAALSSVGPTALWVYFTDKGETGRASLARALSQATARVSPASQERRARMTGGRFVPDYSDIPALPRYVQALENTGARVRHVSRWLNAVSVDADAATAGRIASLPFVWQIAPVMASHADLAEPTDYGVSFTQNDGIRATAAHDSGYSAANVVVAILDTGFRKSHTAVSPLKRIAEWDFVQSDSETANQPGEDDYQSLHGTGVWSILGGYLPGYLIGPAYNASFVLAKVHDITKSTMADEDKWIAGAQWADSIGIDILHTSITVNYTYSALDGKTTPIAQATNTLTRHGVLVVVA